MRLHLTLSEEATGAVNESADNVAQPPREPNRGRVTELLIMIGHRQFMGLDSADLCEKLSNLCRPPSPKRKKKPVEVELPDEPHELDPPDEAA